MTKPFNVLLKVSLSLFFSSFLLGLYFLYIGSNAAAVCATIGSLSSITFTLIVIGEVSAAENVGFATKAIWIVSFIAFQIFAGMAYYFADRKTIIQPPMHAA